MLLLLSSLFVSNEETERWIYFIVQAFIYLINKHIMSKVNEALINEMYEAGAHVGYTKSRRHPSTKAFIFESRKKKDIINSPFRNLN